MFQIIGIVLLFGLVFGSYAISGGKFDVITHAAPHELMAIGGAGIAAFLISNSVTTMKATLGGLGKAFGGAKWKKQDYKDLLSLLFQLTKTMKSKGVIALESHIEKPAESTIFQKYPKVLKDHFAVDFICDTLRMMTMNLEDPHQIEDAMEKQLEKHHHEAHAPAHALQNLADALPALGIVAAVLGVIKTMGSITEPPEVLGGMIGGALVGTFLGVFLAYGLVGPLAARDELGALAGHLDQLLDAIEDKTAALQRWADELDRKVAERTRELQASNASLQLAQAQLVKSEKLAAIGQLTASIAHEINNPIAVMQGNLDLMRETLGPQADAVKDELALLDQQVERMRIIVTQLLQYARPTEFGGYVSALDLNRTVADCLVLVAHLLSQTRITVERDLQATKPVGMNRQELQQVVINLLINAIQAMPDGGTLTLGTRDHDQSDSDGAPAGASLWVQDRGPGLSEATLQRLFRPFFTTKNDGNGLGLWISQGLVERYGGSIRAGNREDGTGAWFCVRLFTEPVTAAPVDTGNGRPGLLDA